jgi:hypothetical protein
MKDEIKIGQVIEKELDKEEQFEINKAIKEDLEDPDVDKGDAKNIIISVVVILGLFGLIFGGATFYNGITSAAVIDVDELHQENLEGDLDEDEGYVHNGYSFVKVDGLWWTEMDKFGTLLKVPLHFGPKELEEITIEGSLSQDFNVGEDVHIAIDPKVVNKYYTLSVSELSFNVVKGMDRRPVGSCTEEGIGCEDRPIISCDNNPDNKPVIELVLSEEPNIELNGACIKISGYDYDLVKGVDRILLQWYGIMD